MLLTYMLCHYATMLNNHRLFLGASQVWPTNDVNDPANEQLTTALSKENTFPIWRFPKLVDPQNDGFQY